jgi:hypothetical protein
MIRAPFLLLGTETVMIAIHFHNLHQLRFAS